MSILSKFFKKEKQQVYQSIKLAMFMRCKGDLYVNENENTACFVGVFGKNMDTVTDVLTGKVYRSSLERKGWFTENSDAVFHMYKAYLIDKDNVDFVKFYGVPLTFPIKPVGNEKNIVITKAHSTNDAVSKNEACWPRVVEFFNNKSTDIITIDTIKNIVNEVNNDIYKRYIHLVKKNNEQMEKEKVIEDDMQL